MLSYGCGVTRGRTQIQTSTASGHPSRRVADVLVSKQSTVASGEREAEQLLFASITRFFTVLSRVVQHSYTTTNQKRIVAGPPCCNNYIRVTRRISYRIRFQNWALRGRAQFPKKPDQSLMETLHQIPSVGVPSKLSDKSLTGPP
jgi:hypothetical protein